MIKSRSDYKKYLKKDLIQTGIYGKKIYCRLTDPRYKLYKLLRYTEYRYNCKTKFYNKIFNKLSLIKYTRFSNKFGISIPINVVDEGLTIVHIGPIIISSKAKIGKNCRIHVGVNIGNAPAKGIDGAPVIGNNVYIGPGAKIFGGITIGDNVAIGANAVVNKSFESNITIAGVPAKKISDNNSKKYIL